MSHRVKDKAGNRYEVLTEQEQQERTDEPLTFKSEKEAMAFVKEIMSTPEGEAEMLKVLAEVTGQRHIH